MLLFQLCVVFVLLGYLLSRTVVYGYTFSTYILSSSQRYTVPEGALQESERLKLQRKSSSPFCN
jgi:hypothetical protein